MGIFNWNKSNNPSNYISDTIAEDTLSRERETVEKSMKARAVSRDDLATALSTGDASEALSIDKNEMLANKNILYEYSKNIIVQSIIRTRTNQVLKYARPARYSNENIGFEVIPKETKDDTGKLDKEQQKKSRDIEEFLMNTGSKWYPQRKDFPAFLSELIYNRYVYDQINMERIFKSPNSNKLDHFNMVDARTIVLNKIPKSRDEPREFAQYPDSKKLLSGKPILFKEKNLTFVVYNNQSDIKRRGYGYSEVEASLDHLKFHMDTEQFNARFFAQGGTTRGILVVDSGDKSGAQQNAASLSALRRQWQASFSGTNGAWKIPVISAHDAKYVNMTQSSKDMEKLISFISLTNATNSPNRVIGFEEVG